MNMTKTILFLMLVCSPSWAQTMIRDPFSGRTSVIEPIRERDQYELKQFKPAWESSPQRVDIYAPSGSHRGTGTVDSNGVIVNDQTGYPEGRIR